MNDNDCKCQDCKASLTKPLDQLTPEEVREWKLGCFWCAGTGYEDYPTCRIPCRDKEYHHHNETVLRK